MKQDFETHKLLVEKNKPFIVKLNIRSPNILFEDIDKPYNEKLDDIMTKVGNDLFNMCHSNCIYYFHDEILIFFTSNFIFLGEIDWDLQRIVTILASFASVRFNFYFQNTDLSDFGLQCRSKFRGGLAHFYGKGFSLNNNEDMCRYLFSKTTGCIITTLNKLGQKFIKNFKCIKTKDEIDSVILDLNNENVYWDDLPETFRYGVFIKERLQILNNYKPYSENIEKNVIVNCNIYISNFDYKFILGFINELLFWD